MSGIASPTLTMRLAAPEVLAGFVAMRKEADALKASLAGLATSGGSRGTFTRMQAEVNELKAALAASRLEVDKLSQAVEQRAARAVSAKKQETAAEREALAAKKATAAEEERLESQRLARQLTSGKMTSDLAIRQNKAVEDSLSKSLLEQERMRDRALDRQFRQTQAAYARNERLTEQARARNAAEREADAVAATRVAARVAAAQAAAAARGGGSSSGVGRSVARGVAGAGGALFLTYGQSIPALAAGYGAAVTTREAVQRGSEFSYQTTFAGALGGMKPEDVARMRDELRKLGTDSVYGPIELAKGMRVLTQAGVEAGDALRILPVSMKMAMQGETDLSEASETLVGVMRQYKLNLSDIPSIGDAISKTASVTQANVKSLMESFKASVGVSMYGVDLKQSLANFGVLAKQGITGSSAGTFFRRFTEDMYMPRSMEAQRAFREVGFSPYRNGQRRDFREVQEDIVTKLQSYDPESRLKLMGAMFDIRGLKDANTLVSDLAGEFKKLRDEIDNSNGSLDLFAKVMSGDTKLSWTAAKNNLENSLIGAFLKVEPQINSFVQLMREAFNSNAVKLFFEATLQGFVKIIDVARPLLTLLAYMDKPQAKTFSGKVAGATEFALDSFVSTNPLLTVLPAPIRAAIPGAQAYLHDQIKGFGAPGAGDWTGSAGVAPQSKQMDGSVYDFRAGEMEGTTAGQLGKLPAEKRASRRLLNPLETKEQLDFDRQLDQSSQLRAAREMRRIEQEATFETQILDEKHKHELIGEHAYTVEIERIQDTRRQLVIATLDREMKDIEDRKSGKLTAAQREEAERRQMDLGFKRDEQLREAEQAKKIRDIRREGKVKQIDDETSKILEGFRRAEDLRVEQRDLQYGLPFMRPGEAAEASTRFSVKHSYDTDLLNVDEQIKRSAGDGAALQGYRRRREEIVKLRDAMTDMQGEEAKLRVERERTWGYGQQTALREWADNATNAARQAREAWTTALDGAATALTNFVMTGKGQFKDFAMSIVAMLVRIRIERTLAGLVDAFLTSGGKPGGGVGGASTGSGDVFGVTNVGTAHSGGVAGFLSNGRYVSSALFANAPRFHGGGIAPGEVPIIARHGEGVFTPEQMRNLAPASAAAPRIQIINNGTPQDVQRVDRIMDAEGAVIRIITQDLRRNGPVAREMQNSFNLDRHAPA